MCLLLFLFLYNQNTGERESSRVSPTPEEMTVGRDSGDRQEESRSRWWDKPRAAWLSMFIQFSIIYATVVRI